MFARAVIVVFLTVLSGHAELIWERPVQEFRRPATDRELLARYAFRNTGSQPVTVLKVTTSCGCTIADLAKKTYQPGEDGNLEVTFTFGWRSGLQTKSVTVTTDDRKETQLTLKCEITGQPVLAFSASGQGSADPPRGAKLLPESPSRPSSAAPRMILSTSLVYWRIGEASKPKRVEVSADNPDLSITGVSSTNPRIVAKIFASGEKSPRVVTIEPVDTEHQESAQILVQTSSPGGDVSTSTVHVRIK